MLEQAFAHGCEEAELVRAVSHMNRFLRAHDAAWAQLANDLGVELDPKGLGEFASLDSCTGGPAQPLSVQLVLEVLREHGFSVSAVTTGERCSGFAIPEDDAELAAFAISNDASGSYEEVQASEGIVPCILRQGPIWGPTLEADLDAPAASPIFSGDVADFELQNLDCRFYPGGDKPRTQVERMDRAMHALLDRSTTG
jgi:hypothetical protein